MSKHFELLQQSHEEDLFHPSGNPAEPWVTVVRPPVADRRKRSPQEMLKGVSLPIQWLNNIIQERVRSWRQRAHLGSHHREFDLETIAREEAIKLVQRVFRAGNGRAPQAVAFSGVEADGGCVSICARVGEILAAQAAGPVCLVDANFQSPCLHQYFGIENRKGLAEAILEPGPIQDFAQRVPDHELWVMPSGLASARLGISLTEERLQARMMDLRSTFQRVVIHSSPLGLDTDSLLLSRWTDGVVLVVEAHTTRREAARRAKENLEMADVRMLGVVLNNRTFPIPEAVYRRL